MVKGSRVIKEVLLGTISESVQLDQGFSNVQTNKLFKMTAII